MAKVHAHTSKVGYHVSRGTSRWTTRNTEGSIIWDVPDFPVMGISYKSQTQGSDGHKPTSYSRSVIRATGKGGTISRKYFGTSSRTNPFHGSGLAMHQNPWGQYGISSGSVKPSGFLRERAITAAIEKMHGQNAFILEDLAQAAKTAKEVYDLFKEIISKTGKYLAVLYAAISFWDQNHGPWRGRYSPKKAKRSKDPWLKRLANAWLAWYYGIKPLISTINAIGAARKPRTKSVKVRVKRSALLDPSGLFSQSNWGGLYYTFSGFAKEEVTVTLMLDVVMSDTMEALANLGWRTSVDPNSSDMELGLNVSDGQALQLGWALIPYSFVFDWVIPVEKFLSTLTWSPGITYKGGFITNYMGGYCVCQEKNYDPNWVGDKLKGQVEALLFQRETYHNFAPPASLAVNQGISPTNALNAAQLLIARYG